MAPLAFDSSRKDDVTLLQYRFDRAGRADDQRKRRRARDMRQGAVSSRGAEYRTSHGFA